MPCLLEADCSPLPASTASQLPGPCTSHTRQAGQPELAAALGGTACACPDPDLAGVQSQETSAARIAALPTGLQSPVRLGLRFYGTGPSLEQGNQHYVSPFTRLWRGPLYRTGRSFSMRRDTLLVSAAGCRGLSRTLSRELARRL